MAHELPKLPFAFDALEPHLDRQTMEIHYGKHHQAYLTNFTKAIQGAPDLQAKPIVDILRELDRVPESIRTAVRNHGGGFFNHCFYWACMSPDKGGEPTGTSADVLRSAFGGFAPFKEKFMAAAMGHFGSGWAWLVRTRDGRYEILSTLNQDCPISQGSTPILVVDLWEHAYYLKYKNRRADFVAAWWNVVDWDAVSRRI
jgi:Fe-Mn family superoxide dismutase